MEKKDKMYPVRVNRDTLQMAMWYCDDNNISLAEEMRGVIGKYAQEWNRNVGMLKVEVK